MSKKLLSLFAIVSSLLVTMPAMAAETGTMKAATSVNRTAIISCVNTAVVARENAIDSAFTTYSSAQSAALTARSTALAQAWTGSDNKAVRTAVTAAWNAYRDAHKSAVQAHNAAVKTSWSTFRTAAMACRPAKANLPVETQSVGQDSVQ